MFGHRVREERERLGLSLRELARRAGLDPGHLSRIERGERPALTDAATALAEALKVNTADLMLDGPLLIEVEFEVELGRVNSPWFERRLLSHVPDQLRGRVGVWPWLGDGFLRLRSRSSASLALLALEGLDLGVVVLPAPRLAAVCPSLELLAVVPAESEETAQSEAARLLGPERCFTSTRASEKLWRIDVDVGDAAESLSLQGLAPSSPFGLFVPRPR